MKQFIIPITLTVCAFIGVSLLLYFSNVKATSPLYTSPQVTTPTPTFPLNIQVMRARQYPGSPIVIEQVLEPGSNYTRAIASYKSDGLKIFALITIPQGIKPETGWPVIVFNHGYIPPEQYRTTERYIAYVDSFARSGYIVFRPDYRGHGESEGIPEGAYYSPAYTIDVLNAVSSMQKYSEADSERVGMWGHSLGGNIALRSIVTKIGEIKAAVIWGGVVGSYDDLVSRWRRVTPWQPSPREAALRRSSRQKLFEKYGSPSANLEFWNSIDPIVYVDEITTPVQIHHGTSDEEVPVAFAESLYGKLKTAGKVAELYTYEGGDHNISDPFFSTAMARSIEFFDRYLK